MECNLPDSNFSITEDEKKILFEPGTVINIRHTRVFDVIVNTVQKYDENNIYVYITRPFLESNILTGDSVSCQIFKGDYEYAIFGVISNIDISIPSLVKVNIEKIYKHVNLRKEKRFTANYRANIINHYTQETLYAIIKNLSATGVALICNGYLPKNTIVTVKFASNLRENEKVEFDAKVVRTLSSSGFAEYGMITVNISEKNKLIIKELVSKLEQDEKTIFRHALK